MTDQETAPDSRPRRLGWEEAAIAIVIAAAAFGQRVFISLDIGERQPAILELLPVLVVLTAAVIVVARRWHVPDGLISREFLLIWGPYLGLSLLIPLIGVATGQFPLRGVAAVRVPVTAVSAVIIGAATVSPRDPRHPFSVWQRPLTIAAVVVLLYAILQQAIVSNLLPPGPWDRLISWDLTVQSAYGRSLVVGRSSAFFTNPNILGVWAGIALLIGLLAVQGRWRYTVVGAALATLVLSQSRGPTLGCLLGLVVVLILAMRQHESPSLRAVLTYAPIVALVLVGWALLSAAGAPVSGLLGRFGQGVQVIVGGEDPNLMGRFQFWSAGLALLRTHPWGTFGPPELILGTPVDSEWVRTLLQGGALLIIGLALALFGSLLLLPQRTVGKHGVWAVSTMIIVSGITEIPLQYPPAVLYWALVGAALSASWHASRTPEATTSRPNDCGLTGPRLLMVATVSRTLDAFLRPMVEAARTRGWAVEGMANGISASGPAHETYEAVHEIGWSRQPLALRNLTAMLRARDVVAAGRFDVIHVHTPVAAFLTRLSLGALAERRPRIIYSAHGFHFHRTAGRLRNLAYLCLERLASRWTDELVVVNAEDRQAALSRRLIYPQHLHLIPGVGFDQGSFDPALVTEEAAVAVRREHRIPQHAPLLVSVAELNQNKNQGYLLEAMAALTRPDVHLALIGDGPLREQLARQVQRRRLGMRVHMIARARAVPPFLKSAAGFVLTSKREGLPVSVIEAMAMGVPVIGTDVRGTRDLLADGRGIIVALDDPPALAAALEEVLSNPERGAAMAGRARTYVTSELTTERVVAEYLDLYAAVLNSS